MLALLIFLLMAARAPPIALLGLSVGRGPDAGQDGTTAEPAPPLGCLASVWWRRIRSSAGSTASLPASSRSQG